MAYSFNSTTSYATTSSSTYTNSPPPTNHDLFKGSHPHQSPSIFIPSRNSTKAGIIPLTSRTLDLVDEDESGASSHLNDDISADVFTMDMDTDSNNNLSSVPIDHTLVVKLNDALTYRSPIPRIRPSKRSVNHYPDSTSTPLSQSSPSAFGRSFRFGVDSNSLGKYHPAHFGRCYQQTLREDAMQNGGDLALSPTPTLHAVKVLDDDIPTLDLQRQKGGMGGFA